MANDTQAVSYFKQWRPEGGIRIYSLMPEAADAGIYTDYNEAIAMLDKLLQTPKVDMAYRLGRLDTPPAVAIMFLQKLDQRGYGMVVAQRMYYFGLPPGMLWEKYAPDWYNELLEVAIEAHAAGFFSINVVDIPNLGDYYNVTLAGNTLDIADMAGDNLFRATCMVVEEQVVKLESITLGNPLKQSSCVLIIKAALAKGHNS